MKESSCLQKLKSSLPKRISNYIKLLSIKNGTLLIGVTHSAIKMELNNDYNISLIKRVLKLIAIEEFACEKYCVDKVKIFLSMDTVIENEENICDRYHTKEASKGYFINQATDSEIKDIFEKLRISIKLAH
jgi:hypothetical protein